MLHKISKISRNKASVDRYTGWFNCLHDGSGPFVGKRHDARMLAESGLMEQLEDLMPPDDSNGRSLHYMETCNIP
jgi:hypothetical protein